MPHDPEDTPVVGLQSIPVEALPSEDETPTAPDLPFVTCPRCRGTCEVFEGADGGVSYRRVLAPCSTCPGPDGRPTGFVTRAQHTAFSSERAGDIETTPPPPPSGP